MPRLVQWAAPAIERMSATSAIFSPAAYERGRHFRLLTREPGQERPDLPIWVSTPNLMAYEDVAAGPVVKTAVPGVQGAFVLSNVLSLGECDQINSVASAMGFTEDAPVSLGRRIRQNLSCVWLADDTVWAPVWRRIASHMPSRVAGGQPAGLNQRWRLYRYGENDVFRLHTDGSWPGSKAEEGGGGEGSGEVIRDGYGDRWSQLTVLLYLDEGCAAGEDTKGVLFWALLWTIFLPVWKCFVLVPRFPFWKGVLFWNPFHSLVCLWRPHVGFTRGPEPTVGSSVLYWTRSPPCVGNAGEEGRGRGAPFCF